MLYLAKVHPASSYQLPELQWVLLARHPKTRYKQHLWDSSQCCRLHRVRNWCSSDSKLHCSWKNRHLRISSRAGTGRCVGHRGRVDLVRIRVQGKVSVGLLGRWGVTGARIERRRQSCAYYGLLAVSRYSNKCHNLSKDLEFFQLEAQNDGG